MAVLVFRRITRSSAHMGDFATFCVAAFWGLVILGLYEWGLRDHPDKIASALANPLAAGLALSLIGILYALLMAFVVLQWRRLDRAIKKRLGSKRRLLSHFLYR